MKKRKLKTETKTVKQNKRLWSVVGNVYQGAAGVWSYLPWTSYTWEPTEAGNTSSDQDAERGCHQNRHGHRLVMIWMTAFVVR